MHTKVGEFGLIEQVKTLFAPLNADGIVGIGDDCAVIPNKDHSIVVTTDMLCQDVHFTLDMGGYAIGRRAVMVNLSDVASMGAEPTAILLSIGVPSEVDDHFLTSFFEGVRSCGVALIGGDTTRSEGGLVVNITAMGSAQSGNIKLRSGAQIGDVIMVAGLLGGQSAGGFKAPVTAQTAQGAWLGGRSEVHSMMDISDGLAGDLRHILRASGVGATVELDNIPVANGATLEQALGGGEDFVMLLTCGGEYATGLQAHYADVFGTFLYRIGIIRASSDEHPAGFVTYTNRGVPVNMTITGYTHF